MVKIIQPRLGFVYYLHADVGSGKVTFDAGELFMVGLLPAVLDMVHAVASSAETGVPRRVIAPGHKRCEEHANDNSCSQGYHCRKPKFIIISHFVRGLPCLLMGGLMTS